MAQVHALVAELLAYLVDAAHHADDEAFEIKLRRYAEVHVDVERVVVRDEGARVGSARDGREYRRLDLESTVAVEDAAEGLYYLRALAEDVAHLGVRYEVGVALAVADLHVLEAVVLLGHRAQRLREKREAAHRERQLAALRAEGNADEADEVARVDPFFEEGVVLLAEHVKLEAELQAVEAVLEGREGRLSVAAQDDYASRRLYLVLGPLFGLKIIIFFFDVAEALLHLVMVLLVGVVALFGAEARKLVLALAENFLFRHDVLLRLRVLLLFCHLNHISRVFSKSL